MNEFSHREFDAILRSDLCYFAERCFAELNPQAAFATNWHLELIAAKLIAVREGRIRRLIINLPPRHLKSLMASIAFPAWCLGHDPSAQILCVSYAQDLADKLARDCRAILMSPWYGQIFPAIAEADEVHRIETIWGPRCFRRRQGEALHPDREPLDTLDRIRRTLPRVMANKVMVGSTLSLAAAQGPLIEHIVRLDPFGASNPEPRFFVVLTL